MNEKDMDVTIEDSKMDDLMNRVGAEWAEDSSPPSEAFLASFECELRGAATAKSHGVRPPCAWKKWLVPALAAASVVGLLAALFEQPQCAGLVFFQEGDLSIQGASSGPGILEKGDLISTGADGEGFLSLDQDRVNLFLNHETAITLKTADTIRLERGEIWVRVDPESGFFGIDTPHGFVQVVGTTFGITVGPRETRVEIAAGKVKVGTEEDRICLITPGSGATLSFDAPGPVLHESHEEITPAWAEELFSRAAAAQAMGFFPSASPQSGP